MINKIRHRRAYAWTGHKNLGEFGGSKWSRTNPGQTTEHGSHTTRRVSQAEREPNQERTTDTQGPRGLSHEEPQETERQ